jgi:DNA-binding winged helix-turn-helix (wHTH) protein
VVGLIYLFQDFSLDTDRRELRRGTELLAVEPKVFDLLVHLIANRERVVSKDGLIAAVWGGPSSRNRRSPAASMRPGAPLATAALHSA